MSKYLEVEAFGLEKMHNLTEYISNVKQLPNTNEFTHIVRHIRYQYSEE